MTIATDYFANFLELATLEECKDTPILCELDHLAILELKGKDVLPFLHRTTTNSILDLKKGEACQTIFSNDKGRIVDAVQFLHCGEKFLLVCNKTHIENLILWLDKYTILDDISVEHVPEEYYIWQCWNFFDVASDFGTWLKWDAPDNSKMSYFIAKKNQKENAFFQTKKDVPTLKYWNSEIYDYYRISHSIVGSNEINEQINPHEAGLIYLVDFKKGCYIGQEVIARLDAYDKVKKYLCQFSCEASKVEIQEPIFTAEGKKAGYVTSFSNYKNNSLGLLYLLKKHSSEVEFFLTNKTAVCIKNKKKSL